MIKSMIFDYQSEEDEYKAKDIRAVYKNFMSNGVLLEKDDDISTNTKCKVIPITGGVKISSGVASINGSQAIIEDEDVLITENGTYKIVLEFNLVLNKFVAKYIVGTKPLTRTDTVHQIQLAQVVKSGATYAVTDTRADTNVCGYANRMIDSQADNLRQRVDRIYALKNIMTVSTQENEVTLPNATGTLSFDKVLSSVGTSLSNSHGGIRIGAGINKVKVSGNIWINANSSNNRLWCSIVQKYKNGALKRTAGSLICKDPCGFASESISSMLVDVEEGDYFIITYINDVAGMVVNGSSGVQDITNLTVEVVN